MKLRPLLPAVCALALLASACGGGAVPGQEIRSSFLPQDVDFIGNIGISPSIAVDGKGIPHLAYIGLEETNADIPVQRPISAPIVPAVLTASQAGNGLWTHGAAIQSKTGTGAKTIPLTKIDTTALTVDEAGHSFVVWTQKGSLYYSDDTTGSFSEPAMVAPGVLSGPSIALGPGSNPLVSYRTRSGVFLASKSGKKWETQQAARVPGCLHCAAVRTSLRIGPKGPVIAYQGAERTPSIATRNSGRWSAHAIRSGDGGFGISLVLDIAGAYHATYYSSDGHVRVADSTNGTSWTVGDLGSFGATDTPTPAWSTAIRVDKRGKRFITWYDPSSDSVELVTQDPGGKPKAVDTGASTNGGESPALAVTPDGGMFLAWYDAVEQDLFMGSYPVEGGVTLAVPTPEGSAPAPPAPSGTCEPKGTTVSVVAEGVAFDTDCLAAPAGKPFEIAFDNKDAGVPHNVDVYSDPSAKEHIAGATATEVVTGPAKTTYKVASLKAGMYYFRCDVHPTNMFGTFIVK